MHCMNLQSPVLVDLFSLTQLPSYCVRTLSMVRNALSHLIPSQHSHCLFPQRSSYLSYLSSAHAAGSITLDGPQRAYLAPGK